MARLSGLYAQTQPADLTLADPGLQPGEASPGANRVAFAPNTQWRVMRADRAYDNYTPQGVDYAAIDPQRGGAPGDSGSGVNTSSGISSQGPTGVTTMGGVPVSPVKQSYGQADWTTTSPSAIPQHQSIKRWSNPNRPQINPTPTHNEGPVLNTQYAQPGPWSQGVFLGT